MTTTTSETANIGAEASDASQARTPTESLTPTLRERLRRSKQWFWILPIACLIVVLTYGTQMARAGGEKPILDPSSPAQLGGRALVEVLRHHGVDVDVVTHSTDLATAAQDPASTTVLVHDRDGVLSSAQWQRLAELRAKRIVVVGALPGPELDPSGSILGAGSAPTSATSDDPEVPVASVAPGNRCADLIGTKAPEFSNFGGTATVLAEGVHGSECYPAGSGHLITMTTPKGSTSELVVVSSPHPFTNSRLDDADNAAVAIGLLGDTSHLLWYEPMPELNDGSVDLGPGQYVPAWLTPAMLLLVCTVIATCLVRGRRLGRLVHERLPVVVRASETVEGRARLYARAGARLRAADALRIGTLTRCANALGLSRATPAPELADAIAAASGTPRERAHYLLLNANPTSDADLMRLSDELLTLERTVTRTLPGTIHDHTTNGAHDVR